MNNPINSALDEAGACLVIEGLQLDENASTTLGTGYGYGEEPVYPFPRIYNRSTPAEQARRDAALAEAKLNNYYNTELIPGVAVHGNITAPEHVRNSFWQLHGSEDVRSENAREDKLGIDDSDPGEDGIDIYESMFVYLEQNCELWATNDGAVNNIQQLMAVATNSLLTHEPGSIHFYLVDPVLALVPASRPNDIKYYDFYPAKFPERYPKQPFDAEFRDDDVIAWAQVANSSPFTRLTPYKVHQPNFKVDNDVFRRTDAFKNDDLDQAMAEGRVFVVDYEDFHEFNVRPAPTESTGAQMYAAIAMFAVPKGSDQLKVVAIQSTQNTPETTAERDAWKANNTQDPQRPLSDVLTPADDYWSWQMAKNVFMSMYAMSSVIDHLSTHVYLGPIPVAFYRNIPRQHPLSALLEPHLMSLVSNNHTGIFGGSNFSDLEGYGDPDSGLLTGTMNKVSGWSGQSFLDATVKVSKRYDFTQHSTPVNRNKANSFSAIGDVPLFDDNGIYPIIERWARDYLSLYYRSDADVANDHELQQFCYETAVDGNVAGFPSSLSSIDGMVDMTARIIYWMSANHALEATLGCLKLAPLGYWSDRVPRNDEVRTEADWFNIMPPINVGLAIFCASRLFVDLPREWYRSLGRYPQGQFVHDRRVYQHLDAFQQKLFDLDDQIQETNASRRWAYTMMRPATMTCSPWN